MELEMKDANVEGVKSSKEWYRVRCQGCGRFIGQLAIAAGKAKFHLVPDSVCGPEESYWECEKCK